MLHKEVKLVKKRKIEASLKTAQLPVRARVTRDDLLPAWHFINGRHLDTQASLTLVT
jgi:hypothetical protein